VGPREGPTVFALSISSDYLNADGRTSLLKLRHHQFLSSVATICLMSISIVAFIASLRNNVKEKNRVASDDQGIVGA
jgi:hypothetical protein